VPGKESTVPGKENTLPGKESTVPGKESTVPGKESFSCRNMLSDLIVQNHEKFINGLKRITK
jgi:hypothetical protein